MVHDEKGGLVKGLPYRLGGKGVTIERAAPASASTPATCCASFGLRRRRRA